MTERAGRVEPDTCCPGTRGDQRAVRSEASIGLGAERPWRGIVEADIAPRSVARLIQSGMRHFDARIWNDYDTAIVVHRGGALIEPWLRDRVQTVQCLRAVRCAAGARLISAPAPAAGLSRVLICDILADTGETLATCGQWARELFPGAQVELLCLYATELAIGRLSRTYRLHVSEVLGEAPGSMAPGPSCIPYDFGEVAEQCGMV